MADDVDAKINVETAQSVRNVDELRDATRQAGTQLDDLDAKDISPEIDVDDSDIRRAGDAMEDLDRKSRGAADGIGFQNSALSDLTGPLGDATGSAGEMGDAFEGLGEIVGGIGAKFGLGEEAATKLAAGIAGVGVAVAGAIAIYSVWKTKQEQAKKAAEDLLGVQEKIRDGKFDDAVADLQEQWAGTIQAMRDAGYGAEQLIPTLRGQGTVLDELRGRYDDLQGQIDELTAGQDALAYDSGPGVVDSLREQQDEIGRVIANLEEGQRNWQSNGDAMRYNADVALELRGSLGQITDAADDAADAVAGIKDRFNELTDGLDEADAIDDVLDAFDDVRRAAIEAWDAAQAGADDAESKSRDYERATRDAIRTVTGLGDTIEGIPDEQLVAIAVAVQQGDVDTAERLIKGIGAGLPPVRIGLDTTYLDELIQNWARRYGPGSNSSGTVPPPPSVIPGRDPSPSGGGFRAQVINNYYPPLVTVGQFENTSYERDRLLGVQL